MRTITKTLYMFNELTEDAKRNAYENWYSNPNSYGFPYSHEYRDTLKKIENELRIKVTDWEVDIDLFNYDFAIDYGFEEATENLTGLRLNKFINNRLYYAVNKYKTYYNWKTGKKHKSKVNYDELVCCCFTGCWTDENVEIVINNAVNYKKIYNTYAEFVKDCLEAFFEQWRADTEYYYSYDGFVEREEYNDAEYYEDGNVA